MEQGEREQLTFPSSHPPDSTVPPNGWSPAGSQKTKKPIDAALGDQLSAQGSELGRGGQRMDSLGREHTGNNVPVSEAECGMHYSEPALFKT